MALVGLSCSPASDVGVGGDGDGDDDGNGTVTGGTGGTGDGATGGATTTGGTAGTGASPNGTGGEVQANDDLDQAAHDASETCIYGQLTLEIEAGGDTNTEAAFVSSISESIYDASSGVQFTVDTDNGAHLVIAWQPPPAKPALVDFSASLTYTAEGGAIRHLCFEGRLQDGYLYPVEPYHTFAATTVFEASSDGSCTTTPVEAALSGCLSENYNL